MKEINDTVIVEQDFDQSIETLWNAITQIDKMRKWYFENIPSFEPIEGFETQFNVKSESRDFLHMWKVIDVVAFKRIKYNWKYKGYKGDSDVTFELFEKNKTTILRVTHEIIDGFNENIPEFKRESCIEGWNYFIKHRLKEYLST